MWFGKNTEAKLHILVVSQYFWPENFRINDLVQEWVLRGHTVTVLTGIPNYPAGTVFPAFKANPGDFSQFHGARVLRVPMLPRGQGGVRLVLNYASFVLGAGLLGPWHLRHTQPDVIFVFEPSPITVGLPAVWLGKQKKVPVVFWTLDLWPETLAAIGVVRSPKILKWIGGIVRYIYNRCTLVLGQSRGFLKSIANHCNDSTKIRYFPSWAEDVFSATRGANHATPLATLAPEVPSQPNVFTIVFAGNIGEAQDMPAVLAAAESLKHHSNIRWVIVGDGRKFEWLKTEVVRRQLQTQVLLPGRFGVERMPSFYAHADALLVSLKRDPVFSMTIPGKVQSYLLAGLPILGMLDGEGAAVIQDANAGLTCQASDAKGLAQAVMRLAEMPKAQRMQLGQNARTYAQQEFGRTELIQKLEGYLQDAIGLYASKHCKR